MNTKNHLIIFVILGLISCLPKTYIVPQQANKPVEIDGNITHNTVLKHDAKTSILYNLQIDSTSLYIKLRFINSETQKKVVEKGLTLWIDLQNKARKEYGIHYPKESDFMQLQQYLTGDKSAFYESFNDLYSSGLHLLEIIDYSKNPSTSVAYTKSDNGISVALAFDSLRQLNYEAKIPLALISKNDTKLISLGVETGKFDYSKTEEDFDMSGTATNYSQRNTGMSSGHISPIDYRTQTSAEGLSSMHQPTRLWIKNVDISMLQESE